MVKCFIEFDFNNTQKKKKRRLNKESYLVMDLQLTPKIKCFITQNPLKKQASKRVRVLKREIFYHENVSSSFVIPVHPN